MKLTFTEKLILDEIEELGDSKKLKFKSYLKEDWVENALIITLTNEKLDRMYFSSNEYGTAEWINGKGIEQANRWETEDEIKDASTIAGRYPSIISDGDISSDIAYKTVIPDVLDNMLDLDFSVEVFNMVSKPSYTDEYNWNKVIVHHKQLTEIFIEEYIKKQGK